MTRKLIEFVPPFAAKLFDYSARLDANGGTEDMHLLPIFHESINQITPGDIELMVNRFLLETDEGYLYEAAMMILMIYKQYKEKVETQ